ncbi:hypothetical protein K9O30_09760 [Clostridium bowmanii]|uniref:hypothetical protein n=1 Tax=Clostridium bowmanii TaxID=132925 RepID=UPI001C0E60EC|nr:hypothetical protein [Clostridium bowmanii]MBU3189384.1 hypothetical protein [Clostridium bowmanii]MCA1073998.1 hypothetical protein [Clostridium bowmanii]
MRKKTIAIIFLFIMMYSIVVSAEGFKYAEIFDPKQDKVVKVVQMNRKIHKIVSRYIKDVDALYGKYNPLTDDGYAIKIPLYPVVKVQGKCLNALVNEVYIIIPENNPPFFMIFENRDKLLCFPFKGDIDKLSKALDFELKIR